MQTSRDAELPHILSEIRVAREEREKTKSIIDQERESIARDSCNMFEELPEHVLLTSEVRLFLKYLKQCIVHVEYLEAACVSIERNMGKLERNITKLTSKFCRIEEWELAECNNEIAE